MKSSLRSLPARSRAQTPPGPFRDKPAKLHLAKGPSGQRQARENRWLLPLCCLCLALVSIAIYARTAWYPFVNFDDGEYVFENSHVNNGLSWPGVKWAMTATAAGNWHPLTWLSHQLDVQLFGLHAGGHHATNVLLHAVNVILLFLLLNRISGLRWRSLAVAALFAVHPLNVESAAWVSERKNLLCTLFCFLAIGAYTWYVRRPGVWRYLCIAVFFALGLASKPMVITLPFMLLLLDWWPLERVEGWRDAKPPGVTPLPVARLILEKVPPLALSLASAIITIEAQRRVGAIAKITGWPLSWRIENAIHSYAIYVVQTFVPVNLAPFYPGAFLHWWQVAWAALFLAAISWLVWTRRGTQPYLLFGWLWYLGTMVPMIGLLQVGAQARADRYMYIPMIGILLAVVWGISDILQRASQNSSWRVAAAAVAVTVLLVMAWQQVSYWKSSEDLWTHALAVTRDNDVAEENLGVSLINEGREEEAFPHFQRVLLQRPDDAVALLNTANFLEKQGRHREAIERFARVRDTSHDPAKRIGAYRGLGVAYAQMGDRANARKNFLQALRINPGGPTEIYNIGLLEVRDGIDKLRKSVSEKPDADSYLQLGQLLQQDERPDDAIEAYENALKLNPHLTEARQAIAAMTQAATN